MKKILCLLITLLVFAACDEPETGIQYKKIRIKKLYRFKVPTYMKKTDMFSYDTSVQYIDMKRLAFTVVIDEEKETVASILKSSGEYDETLSLAENYKNFRLDYFASFSSNFRIYDEKSTTFRGKPSFYAKAEGSRNNSDSPFTFFFRFIEGKNTMYTMVCATTSSQKGTFRYTFSEILGSFTEL